jgi:hypothetical protein
MLGRISLFRGALDVAAGQLDASIKLAEHDHLLAFLPWPQALRGEVQPPRPCSRTRWPCTARPRGQAAVTTGTATGTARCPWPRSPGPGR